MGGAGSLRITGISTDTAHHRLIGRFVLREAMCSSRWRESVGSFALALIISATVEAVW
jgi:hypothetical protein